MAPGFDDAEQPQLDSEPHSGTSSQGMPAARPPFLRDAPAISDFPIRQHPAPLRQGPHRRGCPWTRRAPTGCTESQSENKETIVTPSASGYLVVLLRHPRAEGDRSCTTNQVNCYSFTSSERGRRIVTVAAAEAGLGRLNQSCYDSYSRHETFSGALHFRDLYISRRLKSGQP
jgi:hypothetical protein